jgi:hypothetical protein
MAASGERFEALQGRRISGPERSIPHEAFALGATITGFRSLDLVTAR